MPIFSFSSWHWCPHLSGGSAKAIDTLVATSSTMIAAAARTITVRLITSHLLSLLSAAHSPKRNRPEDLSITRSRLHHWLRPSQVPISLRDRVLSLYLVPIFLYNVTLASKEKERKGAGCLYSPSCRALVFSETGLPALHQFLYSSLLGEPG